MVQSDDFTEGLVTDCELLQLVYIHSLITIHVGVAHGNSIELIDRFDTFSGNQRYVRCRSFSYLIQLVTPNH